MKLTEKKQRDILLVIISLLFVIFTTGLATGADIPVDTTVIPPS